MTMPNPTERRVDTPTDEIPSPVATIRLYWIPLGAGASVVRASGRLFESICSLLRRRRRCDLYHSALEVVVASGRFVIEMAPEVDAHGERRGAVATGAVGTAWAGRFRLFRYEIRCWQDGLLPDAHEAVGGPVTLVADARTAERLLDLTSSVPTPVWGRDELGAGEMWNSNSVTAWLLAGAGVDTAELRAPMAGRAPGWDAGLAIAARS